MARPRQTKALFVILGNQRFPREYLPPATEVRVFIAEDVEQPLAGAHHPGQTR